MESSVKTLIKINFCIRWKWVVRCTARALCQQGMNLLWPAKQECGWVSVSVWRRWRREKSLYLAGNRTTAPISDIVRPRPFRNYAASEQECSVRYRHPWRAAYCAILLKKFLQSFAHLSALRIRALRQGTAKNVRCPWKSSYESCGRIFHTTFQSSQDTGQSNVVFRIQ